MITQNDLSQFTGTENYYIDYLGMKLTDGVKFFASACRCNWLISDISSVYFTANEHEKLNDSLSDGNNFFLIEVKINREEKSVIWTMREDTDSEVLYSQSYGYSDLPTHYSEDTIKFYLIDGVLLLPSEY